MLLRGLVRLHHHRVVAEGHGPETLRGLPEPLEAPVFLLDIDLDDAAWTTQLTTTLPRYPNARAVLLTANRSAGHDAKAHEMGFAYLLRRPFAVHDLVEAIEPPTGA